jgi:hypothetical protein
VNNKVDMPNVMRNINQSSGGVSYLKQLLGATGSDALKKLLSADEMSDADFLQYILSNPEELSGVTGLAGLFPQAANPAAGDAPETMNFTREAAGTAAAAAAPAAAEAGGAAGVGEDGDADLAEFDDDETMAAPTGCSMAGASAADKAKPLMQDNLREVKAVKQTLEAMAQADPENTQATAASNQLEQQEQLIRSCLKRGKKNADASYQAHGIDPKNDSDVCSFVDKIGNEVLKIGSDNGLDIQMSAKRSQPSINSINEKAAAAKAANDAKEQAKKAGLPEPKTPQVANADKNEEKTKTAQGGGGGGDTGDNEVFDIRTPKSQKQQEVDIDEVEGNPVLAEAIREQLSSIVAQQNQTGIVQAPQSIDLGVTQAGSPLDAAVSGTGGGFTGAGAGNPSTSFGGPSAGPSVFGAAPAPGGGGSVFAAPVAAQGAAHAATAGPKAAGGVGAGKVTSTSDIREMLKAVGMEGQKFKLNVAVYEPGAAVELGNNKQGGVSVGGGLSGRQVAIKAPSLVAKDQDGKMFSLSGLHTVGAGGFSAKIKGEADGAVAASKSITTAGTGTIAIPGVKT